MSPPVNTPATGTAEFHINADGSLCYQVRVNNIKGVLGTHIGTKNGTELGDLINPYAVINTQQVYPTGPVNGLLTSGDIKVGLHGPAAVVTYGGLLGSLIDKPVTALNGVIKNKSAYVTVRTLDHQTGEIQGQIVPTSSTIQKTNNKSSVISNVIIPPSKSFVQALPLFHDGGSIILNASIGTSKGVGATSVYIATKAAIRSFARTWTVDLKHRKIRVNAVSPGPIDTPVFNRLAQTEEEIRQIKANLVAAVPMGRIGNPDEIAKAVSFLASDDSSYITGIELFVDGGMAQI